MGTKTSISHHFEIMAKNIIFVFSILTVLQFSQSQKNEEFISDHPSCDGDSCQREKTTKTNKERYRELKDTVESIRQSCGEICDTTKTGVSSKYYDYIQKNVDCDALFQNNKIDLPSDFLEPPARIPKFLKDDFSYQGRIPIKLDYRDDSQGSTHWLNWTMEMMDWHFDGFKKGKLGGSYGKENAKNLFRHMTEHMDLSDKHVLIVGSQRPWLETLVISAGAQHVTTMDYVKIISEHPQITTVLPQGLIDLYFEGIRFDAMVTFSSVEHSGLGRYGDNLNPWGDLIVMARSWCLMKPGGQALVGVPTGPDQIGFNSAKVYGDLLYSHLFANWKQIYTETNFSKYSDDCYYCYQPLHILEK